MKRVVLSYRGQDVLSGRFCMGAWRVMYDLLSKSRVTVEAVDAAAVAGLCVMFDGSVITDDVLLRGWRELDEGQLSAAVNSVYGWFVDVKPHGEGDALDDAPVDPALSLYRGFWPYQLPDALDRQDPQLFFDVAAAKVADPDTAGADEIPDNLRVFYGL